MDIRWYFSASVIGFMMFGVVQPSLTPDVIYSDIEHLNASCFTMDNCFYSRDSDNLNQYNCNCGQFCTRFNTCCVDSKYGNQTSTLNTRVKCRAYDVYESKHVWMIDQCSYDWQDIETSTFKFCNNSGRDLDDPFLEIPVTSTRTGITYKNYFCSICNNDGDKEQLNFWTLSLRSTSKEVLGDSIPELHYNLTLGEWTVGKGIVGTKVHLSVLVPNELQNTVHPCVPRVVSSCAQNWTDDPIEMKCKAYMALARFMKWNGPVTYRNPHCALCNYENLDEMMCVSDVFHLSRHHPAKNFFVGLFSLHDKTNKCEGDKIYDALAKKCRTVYKG